jgi:ankyrin repeat protein
MKKANNFSSTLYNKLFLACELNQLSIIENLIQKGLDINYKKKTSLTAIEVAIEFNQLDALGLLLKNNALVPEKTLSVFEKEESFLTKVFDNDKKVACFELLYEKRNDSAALSDNYLLQLVDKCLMHTYPDLFSSILNKFKNQDECIIKTLEKIEKYQVKKDFSELSHILVMTSRTQNLTEIFLDFLIGHNISPEMENIYVRLLPYVKNEDKIIAHLEQIQLNENVLESNKIHSSKKIKM